MKRTAVVLFFLHSFLYGHSQRVQTIIPRQVVAGNAFQIQYIINDPAEFVGINSPEFDQLKLISGPNYYKGNLLVSGKAHAIENITYTVVPIKTGKAKINAITVKFKNNEEERSDEVTITVLPQPKASFNALSTYTDLNLYAPSSKTDLEKLVEANLFIKAEVDKRMCFLGEGITATFKLYSRLQSTSEVINAPSLYGFSVMDMLNINEAHPAVETIDGKIFNTSILRKLQLYPAQTGKLTIDEMQLQNNIEFNDSLTGKKVKVEKVLASNPIEVTVRALSCKPPPNYTGAVGQFAISAELAQSKIAANTQGKLIVTIAGKGNFIQFGPPVIHWPKEFDVFDPIVSDEINKTVVPTWGKRKYVFSFATDRSGNYLMAPVSFSFFDPSSRQFKKISSDSLRLEITPTKQNVNSSNEKQKIETAKSLWLYFIGIMIVLFAAFLLWRRKKEKVSSPSAISKTNYQQKLTTLSSKSFPDSEFYSEIHKLLKEASKEFLLSKDQGQELLDIQRECQLLIYSAIDSKGKREDIQRRASDLLQKLQL